MKNIILALFIYLGEHPWLMVAFFVLIVAMIVIGVVSAIKDTLKSMKEGR